MTTILERNLGIARRADHLDPISGRIRDVLVSGKREQLLAGESVAGVAFAQLMPSTLRQRSGDPTPLVPEGPASRLITGYRVDVETAGTRIECSAGWPGLDFVRYLKSGTRKMVARDPTGFREKDKAECLGILREHVFHG